MVVMRKRNVIAQQFPIRFLSVAVVLTGVVLAWLGWQAYRSYNESRETIGLIEQIVDLQRELTYLDEALANAARQAAVTGETNWSTQYRERQEELETTIATAREYAPTELLAELEAARTKQHEIETAALDLVDRAEAAEARSLLVGRNYVLAREHFAEAMEHATVRLQEGIIAGLTKRRERAVLNVAVSVLSIPVLVAGWLFVLRTMRQWHRALMLSHRRLSRQAEELAGLNRQLNDEVFERQRAERELRVHHEHLEELAEQRAEELRRSSDRITELAADRKRTAESLRQERLLLRKLMETLPDSIYFKDTDSRFIRINHALADRFGLSDPAEAIGKTDADFFTAQHAEPARRDERAILRTGQALVGIEEKETWPDGHITWVSTTKMPLKDEEGNVIGTYGMSRDITQNKFDRDQVDRQSRELEQSNTELERSNRELTDFAYFISHDLQEPLRAVVGFCQLLKQRYHGKMDSDADDFLDFAVQGAARMQLLIDDLLELSRVHTQGTPPQPTASAEALRQAQDNLKFVMRESGAEIHCTELPQVLADSTQLVQLFQNLIANAIKFSGAKPPVIHIDCHREGHQWVFAVRDQGIGIAEADRERIFAIFQRVDTSRETSGTGVGLAICRRIVERHDGRIWCDSEPGVGSTFRFTLPAAD